MATKYTTANPRNCRLVSSPPEPEPEPKPTTIKHHRTPPCTTTTTTTVQNISNHFARLYANHKNHKFQEKDASCPTLTKSNSQKPADVGKREGGSRRKKEKKSDVLDVEKALAKQRFDDSKKVKKVFDPYQYGSLALDRGRRKSFSCSQNELVDILSCSGVKVVAVDMPPFMQIHAVNCARKTHDSLEKFTSKALALTLKKEFDGVYGPAWHCIVGTSFGSYVTHSVGGFMYFSMDHKLYILLFKTTVQKAA